MLTSMDANANLVHSTDGMRTMATSCSSSSRRPFKAHTTHPNTVRRTTTYRLRANIATKALLGADFSTFAETLGNTRSPRLFERQVEEIQSTQRIATKSRLLTLVEDYAQAEYDLRQFEEFSGRCAMVALTVAMGLEVGMDGHGLFEGMDSLVVASYSFFVAAAMMSSVQVAAYLAEKGVREGERFAGYAGQSIAASYHKFQRERAMSLRKVLEPFVEVSLLAIYKDINVTPPLSSPIPVKVKNNKE